MSYDKYTTMLRHAEDLRQMYDETRFTKSRTTVTTKVTTKLQQNVGQLISCRTTANDCACSDTMHLWVLVLPYPVEFFMA